jgi:hypothetical protein
MKLAAASESLKLRQLIRSGAAIEKISLANNHPPAVAGGVGGFSTGEYT